MRHVSLALGDRDLSAGRLACISENDKALKLLVLDDLLISLDYSHCRAMA